MNTGQFTTKEEFNKFIEEVKDTLDIYPKSELEKFLEDNKLTRDVYHKYVSEHVGSYSRLVRHFSNINHIIINKIQTENPNLPINEISRLSGIIGYATGQHEATSFTDLVKKLQIREKEADGGRKGRQTIQGEIAKNREPRALELAIAARKNDKYMPTSRVAEYVSDMWGTQENIPPNKWIVNYIKRVEQNGDLPKRKKRHP